MRQLTNLEAFYVDNNQISGRLDNVIEDWLNMRNFWVFKNRFSGSFPSSIALWTNLNTFYVYVSYNLLNMDVAALFVHFLTLISSHNVFLAQENELTGTLPPVNWPNLNQFYISNNAFSGTLSDSIGNSTSLTLFR